MMLSVLKSVMNYNLCKKQVKETVWKKIINLILIKKILAGIF
jgi:hypothetical protein